MKVFSFIKPITVCTYLSLTQIRSNGVSVLVVTVCTSNMDSHPDTTLVAKIIWFWLRLLLVTTVHMPTTGFVGLSLPMCMFMVLKWVMLECMYLFYTALYVLGSIFLIVFERGYLHTPPNFRTSVPASPSSMPMQPVVVPSFQLKQTPKISSGKRILPQSTPRVVHNNAEGGVLVFVGVFIALLDGRGGHKYPPLKGVQHDLNVFITFLKSQTHPGCRKIEFYCLTDLPGAATKMILSTTLSMTYVAPTKRSFCKIFENFRNADHNIRMLWLHVSCHTDGGTPALVMRSDSENPMNAAIAFMSGSEIRETLSKFNSTYKIPIVAVLDTCFAGNLLVTKTCTHITKGKSGFPVSTNTSKMNLDVSLRIVIIAASSHLQSVREIRDLKRNISFGGLTNLMYDPIHGRSLANTIRDWFENNKVEDSLVRLITIHMHGSIIPQSNGVYVRYHSGKVCQ
jgi:hypothetical protein